MNKIITRFPPSPTGYVHIGNVRTALFNYLFAKHHGGEMIFRLEDTDKERSKDEYADYIIESLKWLNIHWDNTTIDRQSARSAVYKERLLKLIEDGHAYVSQETPKEPGDRTEVIRFRNPGKKILFQDLIRGPIEFDTTELGDFIIAKSIDEPVYHLAVVVDDIDMGITHVIRGEDHISNTPRQILILEALGAERPIYGHVPLILAPDRSKLSKRKHGEMVSISYYRDNGYMPEALINYLALLGWNPGGEQEIFSMDELIAAFDISRVQKAGAVFDNEKLNWFNREHMRRPENKETVFKETTALVGTTQKNLAYSLSESTIGKLVPLLLERINKLGDIHAILSNGEFDFLKEHITYEPSKLVWKDAKKDTTLQHLSHIREAIEKESTELFSSPDAIKAVIWPYAEEQGRGQVLWPMRYALSGKEKSPDPFTLAYLLGKEATLKRLESAESSLKELE